MLQRHAECGHFKKAASEEDAVRMKRLPTSCLRVNRAPVVSCVSSVQKYKYMLSLPRCVHICRMKRTKEKERLGFVLKSRRRLQLSVVRLQPGFAGVGSSPIGLVFIVFA